MNSAHTRQNTPSNPTREPPLVHIPRRIDPDPHPRIQHLQLLAQPLREPMQQAARPAHHDTAQQQGADIYIYIRQRRLDHLRQGLPCLRRHVGRINSRQRGFGIEERFRGAVALVAKGLVVAVWELEGAQGHGFRGFDIGAPGAVMPV